MKMKLKGEALALRAVQCGGWKERAGMLMWHRNTGPVRVLSDECGDTYYISSKFSGDATFPTLNAVEATEPPEDFTPFLPVLTDPATLGCLLYLVEKAYGKELYLRCRINPSPDMSGTVKKWWQVCSLGGRPVQSSTDHYQTKGEALVAALQAAPKKEED